MEVRVEIPFDVKQPYIQPHELASYCLTRFLLVIKNNLPVQLVVGDVRGEQLIGLNSHLSEGQVTFNDCRDGPFSFFANKRYLCFYQF